MAASHDGFAHDVGGIPTDPYKVRSNTSVSVTGSAVVLQVSGCGKSNDWFEHWKPCADVEEPS
jgi:hypothetical protein